MANQQYDPKADADADPYYEYQAVMSPGPVPVDYLVIMGRKGWTLVQTIHVPATEAPPGLVRLSALAQPAHYLTYFKRSRRITFAPGEVR